MRLAEVWVVWGGEEEEEEGKKRVKVFRVQRVETLRNCPREGIGRTASCFDRGTL